MLSSGCTVKTLLPQRHDVRTMFIHPYLIEEHISQRERELRRYALRDTPHQSGPLRRHSVGRRAGWMLIEIGLALVQGAATPDTPPRQSE